MNFYALGYIRGQTIRSRDYDSLFGLKTCRITNLGIAVIAQTYSSASGEGIQARGAVNA